MASSSMEIVSSSSTPWDIYLSFRGVDTRNNFTAHLYNALDGSGIQTFMDDPELQRGEEIASTLLKILQESKISILVISENYASSSWCLGELVEILQRKHRFHQSVLPVFYKVIPSDVRHQRGSVGTAFEQHEIRYGQDQSIMWRDALKEAAGLSGYYIDENTDEAKLIKEIVERVQVILKPMNLNVFLSFRGVDTRKNFTAHLYEALDRSGIQTFMDDPKLQSGEEISPALLKAIRQSKISILVISNNYASSKWCLNELVEILECRKRFGQVVLPVFYKVKASDVRHQLGNFAEAFEKHEIRNGQDQLKMWRDVLAKAAHVARWVLSVFCKVAPSERESFAEAFEKHELRYGQDQLKKWRAALTEAAELSGHHVDENTDEAKLIKEIVERVQLQKKPVNLLVAKEPVGILPR